jgi:hypothetical protein
MDAAGYFPPPFLEMRSEGRLSDTWGLGPLGERVANANSFSDILAAPQAPDRLPVISGPVAQAPAQAKFEQIETRRQSALVEAQKAVRQVLGWLGLDKLLFFFVGGHIQKNAVNQNTIGLDAIQDVFGTLVSRDVEAFAICAHTTEPPDGFMRTVRVRSIPRDGGDLTAHLNVPNSKRAPEALSRNNA